MVLIAKCMHLVLMASYLCLAFFPSTLESHTIRKWLASFSLVYIFLFLGALDWGSCLVASWLIVLRPGPAIVKSSGSLTLEEAGPRATHAGCAGHRSVFPVQAEQGCRFCVHPSLYCPLALRGLWQHQAYSRSPTALRACWASQGTRPKRSAAGS